MSPGICFPLELDAFDFGNNPVVNVAHLFQYQNTRGDNLTRTSFCLQYIVTAATLEVLQL